MKQRIKQKHLKSVFRMFIKLLNVYEKNNSIHYQLHYQPKNEFHNSQLQINMKANTITQNIFNINFDNQVITYAYENNSEKIGLNLHQKYMLQKLVTYCRDQRHPWQLKKRLNVE